MDNHPQGLLKKEVKAYSKLTDVQFLSLTWNNEIEIETLFSISQVMKNKVTFL